jgi:hypothetical protein
MKKMKKLLLLMMVVGLTAGILAGCSSAEPKDTVKEFLTAIQKGDIEKAHTFVDSADNGYDFSEMMETKDGISGKEVVDAVTKNYKFEELVEVSKTDDAAEIKVKITSVDMSVAATKTIGEVMPMAFASAFSEDKEQAKKNMEKLGATALIKHLKADDAPTATREVTLNLKKDAEGNYKIVSDKNLQEALLANSKELDNMFKKK